MAVGPRPRSAYRIVWFALIVAAIALEDNRAPAQTGSPYGVFPLMTLGGAASAGHDVSEFGTTSVGRARTASGAYHAFAQGSFGSRDLGTLGGAQSTALGTIASAVVGRAQIASGQERAFFVDLGGSAGMINLGTLGGTWSAAYDVRYGIVVGASTTAAGGARKQAFQHVNGVMSAVPVHWGGDSVAMGVNNANDIVGYACTASNASCRAFLFSGGVVTNLGSLGGNSVANTISENGQIVGTSVVSGATRHAFVHANGSMRDLGTLGGTNSEGFGVNDRGEVVGSSQNAAGASRAFLWRDGVMTDLNTLLPAGSGWVLETARAISEGGQIVGTGIFRGARRGFLLTPPADLALFEGGHRSLSGSNLPQGVEVGKIIRYVTSLQVLSDRGITVYDAQIRHTLTGPAEFVEAGAFEGDGTCEVTPAVVTCRMAPVDSPTGFVREVWVRARATGPGAITHHAVVTSDVPDPNSSNDTIAEANRAIALSAFVLTPSSIQGGKASAAQVTLTDRPPAGDAIVRVTSSRPDIAAVRDPFIVPAHASDNTRAFNIIPAVVSAPTPVQITATYGLVSITRTLTVLPPALRQFYLTPTIAIGGCGTSAGRILLTGSAPAGGAVVPFSNTNSKALVPASVTVDGGAMAKNFTVPTNAVTTPSSGQVTASYGGVSQTLNLTVRPIRASTLTFTPNPARGGTTVAGQVTLECPAAPGPVVVRLTTSNGAVAAPTVSSLTIPAGATGGSFSVRTSAVTTRTPVSIHAWVFGVRKTTVLTVTP